MGNRRKLQIYRKIIFQVEGKEITAFELKTYRRMTKLQPLEKRNTIGYLQHKTKQIDIKTVYLYEDIDVEMAAHGRSIEKSTANTY